MQYLTHTQLDDAVLTACELLAGNTQVRSIELRAASDLAYPDLIRFRDLARDHGLTMIVRGVRGIALNANRRPCALGPKVPAAGTALAVGQPA